MAGSFERRETSFHTKDCRSMCPQPRVECALKRGSGVFTPESFPYFLTSTSLMSTPARHASWGPGPLTTSQVHASQCQHRHLPQNSERTQTWEGGTSPSSPHLAGTVYATKNSLGNRSLPNTRANHEKPVSQREISLHSCLHR